MAFGDSSNLNLERSRRCAYGFMRGKNMINDYG